MNKLGNLFLAFGLMGLFACDNEVELAGEYVETPVVYGLLDASADTQFVRINKTFLEEGANAVELAKDAERLIYDTLDVKLINVDGNEVYALKSIERPKDPGLFSSERNVLYYTDTNMIVNNNYRLEIKTPDGKLAKAKTKVLDPVSIVRPEVEFDRSITFKSTSGNFVDYKLKFGHAAEVAKFEVKLFFKYEEVTSQKREFKEVEIPVGTITNSALRPNAGAEIDMPGRRFYEAIAAAVPADGVRREVTLQDCIRIEVFAADEKFIFYQGINGPIDGIAQVRPEYSNVENGLGLFASRAFTAGLTQLNNTSRTELESGSITANRGFTAP